MRKQITAFALVMVFALSLTVKAAGPLRSPRVWPELSFSGTTATCSVEVYANTNNDSIDVTMKLWQNDTLLRTWTKSGNGYVELTKTASVTSGKTYKLTVDVNIKDVPQTQRSITRTCP